MLGDSWLKTRITIAIWIHGGFLGTSRSTSACHGNALDTCCVVCSDGGIGTWQQEMFLNDVTGNRQISFGDVTGNMWRTPRSDLAELFNSSV